MQLINIEEILIPDYRIRKEFKPEELSELASSIQAKGLMHAIVLRNDGRTLIAGERRLRAIKDIYFMGGTITYNGQSILPGLIPTTVLADLSPLEQEEAELEENLRRSQLTWQEQAEAVARLVALRRKQHPEKTETALAGEMGKGRDSVRSSEVVTKYFDDPEVRKAKSLKEAHKIVERKERAQRNAELAGRVGAVYNSSVHRALNEDSLAWMQASPAEQFDLILTDPPYGMNADEFGDSGGLAAGAHGYTDDADSFVEIMGVLARESFRITKPSAHLYWFCDSARFPHIKQALELASWRVFRTPLIWYKPSASRAPWPEHGPQRKYECILFAVKGDRKVNIMKGDVLQFDSDENLGHAAQKPVALFEELIRRSALPGDRILDPFCGTGPIFPAAHTHKCYATGIERDPTAYGIAINRIKELK